MQVEVGDETKRQQELSDLDKTIVDFEDWTEIYKQQVRRLGSATYNVRRRFDLL